MPSKAAQNMQRRAQQCSQSQVGWRPPRPLAPLNPKPKCDKCCGMWHSSSHVKASSRIICIITHVISPLYMDYLHREGRVLTHMHITEACASLFWTGEGIL